MQQINGITSDYKQIITVPFNSNGQEDSFILTLEYRENMSQWIYSIEYRNKKRPCNKRLVTSENILYQQRRTLNFGIQCTIDETIDELDPTELNDFITGRCKLYLLNAKELLTLYTL